MKTRAQAKLMAAGECMAKAVDSERFEWQTMRIFLTVCMHGGEMPMQEIEKVTGWSQAAVSRNIALLGQGVTMDKPGARLLVAEEDPAWRRRKIVRLTQRGRDLCVKLSEVVGT